MDDKNVKTLRDMQRKSKSNKLCFECGDRGASYVCLNFNTFVCTNCSGILRGFNYRVKGISMSSFSPQEMEGLKAGGNSKARKYWLAKLKKDADLPQPGQQEKIRRFIQKKYQDKMWVEGESSSSSDSSDSDVEEERRRRAAAKAAKKEKKAAKKEKKKAKKEKKNGKSASRGDDTDSSSSSSAEEAKPSGKPMARDIKDIMPNAPALIVKPSNHGNNATSSTKAVSPKEVSLLDWDAVLETPSAPPLAQSVTPLAAQPASDFDGVNFGAFSNATHGPSPPAQHAQQDEEDLFGGFVAAQPAVECQSRAISGGSYSAQQTQQPQQLQCIHTPPGPSSAAFGATASGLSRLDLSDPFAELSMQPVSTSSHTSHDEAGNRPQSFSASYSSSLLDAQAGASAQQPAPHSQLSAAKPQPHEYSAPPQSQPHAASFQPQQPTQYQAHQQEQFQNQYRPQAQGQSFQQQASASMTYDVQQGVNGSNDGAFQNYHGTLSQQAGQPQYLAQQPNIHIFSNASLGPGAHGAANSNMAGFPTQTNQFVQEGQVPPQARSQSIGAPLQHPEKPVQGQHPPVAMSQQGEQVNPFDLF